MAKLDKILRNWLDYEYVAGLDEVGRGCGAGPVVTAAVILPKDFKSKYIRDSKKLTEKQRLKAYDLIMENAVSVVCNAGNVKDISKYGIDSATFKTMHKCLDGLTVRPDYYLVDGTSWNEYEGDNADKFTYTCIPQGDDDYACIAAAAIVAKVKRDEYMTKLHELHPEYDWKSNKGYLTPKHIAGLKKHGANKYHRITYVSKFIV